MKSTKKGQIASCGKGVCVSRQTAAEFREAKCVQMMQIHEAYREKSKGGARGSISHQDHIPEFKPGCNKKHVIVICHNW